MYRIIGSDDKEYGPVSADQVRQWLREGRLNRTSRIKPDGSTEWKAIGALPEFDDAFPPLPGIPPRPGAPTETSGLAIASLVCGVVGILSCITAPVGLVLGFLAHSRIRQSQGRLTGSGLATTGIILSVLALFTSIAIVAALLLPALGKAKQRAQTIHCVNNMKQLALAAKMYAMDNNDMLPSATNWCADLNQYVGSASSVFDCPQADSSQGHYAFNAKLSHISETNITGRVVMLFETEGGWNASGGPEMLMTNSRHGGKIVVGFTDGSVETMTPERAKQLRWEP